MQELTVILTTRAIFAHNPANQNFNKDEGRLEKSHLYLRSYWHLMPSRGGESVYFCCGPWLAAYVLQNGPTPRCTEAAQCRFSRFQKRVHENEDRDLLRKGGNRFDQNTLHSVGRDCSFVS